MPCRQTLVQPADPTQHNVTNPSLSDSVSPERLRSAQRSVRAQMGLGVHALVFVVVNAFVWWRVGALTGDGHPPWGMSLGWGLGLAIHAFKVLTRAWRQRWFAAAVERALQRP